MDRVAPNAVSPVGVSTFHYRVDLQWPAAADDANGTAVWNYSVMRNGVWLAVTGGTTYSDAGVVPGTNYTYSIAAVDPRRTGVRPTGAYWGGLGENIDMLSGNLNFTLPLVKAKGRGNWSVPFNLTYNSLNWRKDGGGTWKLGYDIGYGFGWKLQAGSLIPTSSGRTSHYIFTDGTGAEYDLNVQNGGVWTSSEGIYVTFDPNTLRLNFNDGSFCVMGCVAAASEADVGTMYPTLMQDSNGNQVIIRYLPGAGVSWANSSGRIQEIEDTRAVGQTSGRFATYLFSYSNGRLTGITNTINSGENYTFFSETGQSLVSPFDGTGFGQTGYLRWVEVTGLGQRHTFTTDSSGQLTRLTFPYGGYLGWDYLSYQLSGCYQPEVRYRKVSKDGVSEQSYRLDRDGADSGLAVHSKATLYDPNNTTNKYWEFWTSGTFLGLATLHAKRENSTVWASESYTWAPGGGGPYDLVAKQLKKLVEVIDQDCLNFLQSGGQNLSNYASELLSNQLLAVADLSLNSVAAFTGSGGTDLPAGAAAIVVNNNGAFFEKRWTVGEGSLRGGTSRAQAFILLHELGHALEAS